jgi:hypothetical protein
MEWGLLEFELMLEELGTFIAGHARKRIIMGIDANAKLLGTTDYHHVGDQTHMTNMNAMDRERARALHTFIADGDLVATNTFKYTDRNEALATRTNWSGNGTSQIDFIFWFQTLWMFRTFTLGIMLGTIRITNL